jgi:hypothetical protein
MVRFSSHNIGKSMTLQYPTYHDFDILLINCIGVSLIYQTPHARKTNQTWLPNPAGSQVTGEL